MNDSVTAFTSAVIIFITVSTKPDVIIGDTIIRINDFSAVVTCYAVIINTFITQQISVYRCSFALTDFLSAVSADSLFFHFQVPPKTKIPIRLKELPYRNYNIYLWRLFVTVFQITSRCTCVFLFLRVLQKITAVALSHCFIGNKENLNLYNQPETTPNYRKLPHKTESYSITVKLETFFVALSHCFLTREFQNFATKNSSETPYSDPSLNKSAYF